MKRKDRRYESPSLVSPPPPPLLPSPFSLCGPSFLSSSAREVLRRSGALATAAAAAAAAAAARLLLLLDLEQQGAVDVRQHAAKGDGGADQRVQLLVAANGQLQVSRRDALDFEIFGGVLWRVRWGGGKIRRGGRGGKVMCGVWTCVVGVQDCPTGTVRRLVQGSRRCW